MAAQQPTAKAAASTKVADDLRALGVRGVLVRMAELGQLLELRCEMPRCYCPKGRSHFDKKTHPPGQWAPSADHYPRLESDGGRLELSNVRLAHVMCNREDYGWRSRIRTMLEKGKPLEEIAETLNRRRVRVPHGKGKWSAGDVRKAYTS